MENQYRFRAMRREEAAQMFALVKARMKWMDEVGIKQWNVTDYTDVYPFSYYEEKCGEGEAFALFDKETGEMVCAAVLKKTDDRWPDEASAFYVHHLVAQIGAKGAGAAFLAHAEDYARSCKKSCMRLDSAVGNEALERFYTAHGYEAKGTCRDGVYTGILREKRL